jgi:hypothetical protein
LNKTVRTNHLRFLLPFSSSEKTVEAAKHTNITSDAVSRTELFLNIKSPPATCINKPCKFLLAQKKIFVQVSLVIREYAFLEIAAKTEIAESELILTWCNRE